jgi:ribonuclease BN (tRNA processing enzyme)
VPAVVAGARVTAFPVVHARELPCTGLRLEIGGRTLAFSGDTAWTDALVDLSRDADLFVCECQGFDAAPPGHLDYATIASRRAELACRRLLLTHLGPDVLAHAGDLDIAITHDGLQVTL